MTRSLCIFLTQQKMHELSFEHGEFESVVRCQFIYFVEVQLQLSFYYVHVGRSITDEKVIDRERTINCGIQAFYNIIDFYGKESNG